ncbi:hypothetical protein [Rubritalea tangerina]|uniref:PA14 domain-containing protein n=1 Tax=Rubritalea tangerina TaxID=430798 RepID=A0ABW4Z820_9BACT
MKATTNKQDPMELRQRRGRRVAGGATLALAAALGVTAIVHPDLFRAELSMPTAEEREKAKQERKKKKAQKPKRKLSKKDIERLAKHRDAKARKHLVEILVRLEKRIVIAEEKEAETTAKFRKSEDLFESLVGLIGQHTEKGKVAISEDIRAYNDMRMHGRGGSLEVAKDLRVVSRGAYEMERLGKQYAANPSEAGLEMVVARAEELQKQLAVAEGNGVMVRAQTQRYLSSILTNAKALRTQDRNLAVRGFAQPEDHPLSQPERRVLRKYLAPLEMDQLHALSQEMASHYTNLMGDVEAGELAEAADIPYPEALDKLAHQAFAKDNLEEGLNQAMPENMDQLDNFTDALNEAQASAERALAESGGQVPGKPGEPGEGEEDSEGEGKPGEGEQGEGPFGSGGGKGTENSSERGGADGLGQRSKEAVWRSLALESSLAAAQDRLKEVRVDGRAVLANVLPGRRFTAKSPREGYVFIDTWHIIGPWDASVSRYNAVDFSRIYPPETKLDLDAVFTSGKRKRVYDDERGYAGRGEMDGRLTWQFYQSPTVEVRIPREQLANDALYFAYTEVFFEQETEMYMAFASDDAARIRVNGEIVFQDTGLSPYVIAEQVRKVRFKRGINKVLVRLVNGPGPCRFSLLLTPGNE